MPNNTTPSKNEKPSSVDDINAHESSLWKGLFSNRTEVLLCGAGLFFLLINIAVFWGIDTRPNAWLFYLDLRYWSVSFSVAVWITVIWLASEWTDIMEDYLPVIRMVMVICILLAIIFAMQSVFTNINPKPTFLSNVFIIVTTCCTVRSLFLLQAYLYDGAESILWEEAQWFWGMSGFLATGLLILGVMYMTPIKTEIYHGMDGFTLSLLSTFYQRYEALIQNGEGSFALKMFLFLLVPAAVAFVYVAGKWLLIFQLRMRGE